MRVAALLLAFTALGCTGGRQEEAHHRRACAQTVRPAGVYTALAPDILDHHDVYHVVVFSYQNRGRVVKPAETHTFATWVHTRNREVVDQVDISWGPADGQVRVVKNAVPGRNKSLAATLADAKDTRLGYWLLRTDKTFFDAALKQRDGLVRYRALDRPTRPAAVNCIHACSDVAGRLDTKAACGLAAGKQVADFYVRAGRAWPCADDWVLPVVMKTNNCTLP